MDYEKEYECGNTVFVNDELVGFVGAHPSGVDYYYSEQGYNCDDEVEVADTYHGHLCDKCSK